MLVRRAGQPWGAPDTQRYEDETALQQLISESPGLVAREDAERAVALQEFTIPSAGSLDVLLIHADGQLTLVEAKLNRNAEIRRAVVGQLLGYAGGLWQMSYDQLDAQVRSRHGRPLGDLVAAVADDTFDEAAFRQVLDENLRSGTFRLVFAVDEITEDLRRAVEYLNASTTERLEVVVLQLDYARVGDVEILQPRVFGEESARHKQSARVKRPWTESDFLSVLAAEVDVDQATAICALIDWARPRVKHFYWGEGQSPSCTMVFDTSDGAIQPLTISTGAYQGFSVNFEWIRKRPNSMVEAFLDDASAIDAISELRDGIVAAGYAKRPNLPLSLFDEEVLQTLAKAIESLITDPPGAS